MAGALQRGSSGTRFRRRRFTPISEINVTPLVDVMLVLLIVFMVTAPLLIQAVPVTLPQTSASVPPAPSKQIQLSIDSAGKIYLDTGVVEREQLKARLQALRKLEPELNVQLMADERIPYGQVAKVMGIVQQAGITKLSFVTVSE